MSLRPLLLLALLLPGLAHAVETVGRIAALVGSAELERSDGSRVALQARMPVAMGESLLTGPGSHLKLLLRDDSLAKLGPDSRMRVEHLKGVDGADTEISLDTGRLRSVVGRRLQGSEGYRIRTSVALTEVRGTDHEVLHIPAHGTQPATSAARTFEGLVTFGDGQGHPPVALRPNFFSLVRPGAAPQPARPIDPGTDLAAQLAALGIERPTPQSVPGSGALPVPTTPGGPFDRAGGETPPPPSPAQLLPPPVPLVTPSMPTTLTLQPSSGLPMPELPQAPEGSVELPIDIHLPTP